MIAIVSLDFFLKIGHFLLDRPISQILVMYNRVPVGGLVTQAIRGSPPTTGVTNSDHGHTMWVSWWVWIGFSRGSSVFPNYKFHSTISPNSYHPYRFISFHQSLWLCDRRGRPPPLLCTDIQYRGVIASNPSIRPYNWHELRIFINGCHLGGEERGEKINSWMNDSLSSMRKK